MKQSKEIRILDYLDNYKNSLSTPYEQLNESLQGGFKKGTSTLFAGLSGSGQSKFINSLLVKMLDEELDIDIIHLSFNDSPIKRKIGLALNKGKYSLDNYNREDLDNLLALYSSKNIIYNDDMLSTIKILELCMNYTDRKGYVVVVIEDIFNIQKSNEKNDFDLSASIVELVNTLKKHNFVIICTNRFNGEIEKEVRVLNPNFHHAVRNDIYNGNYIFNAFSNVYSFHNPRLLNIVAYGTDKRDTKGLIHIRKLKASEGKLSNIWLRNVLNSGHFIEPENNLSI